MRNPEIRAATSKSPDFGCIVPTLRNTTKHGAGNLVIAPAKSQGWSSPPLQNSRGAPSAKLRTQTSSKGGPSAEVLNGCETLTFRFHDGKPACEMLAAIGYANSFILTPEL